MAQERRFRFELEDQGVWTAVQRVCTLVRDAGGRAWLVGGGVRDNALGRPARDVDVEVFGLAPDALRATLGAAFALDLVGQSFGILKLKGLPIDVGLPRRESKQGLGHRGFEIRSDPQLPLPAAAARRDFTVNAVYFDPLAGELADPCGGLDDLRRRILRHASPAFGEDPLRVLRGMQLVARFDLAAAADTVRLCRGIEREGLAAERVFEEWRKLILLGATPSRGLRFLEATTWLRHFPELDALRGVPQDPRHHPEGDVWVHVGHAMDAYAGARAGDDWEDLVVGFAVLCHDLGKPVCTTAGQDGRIHSYGHEQESVIRTEAFLENLAAPRRLVAEVLPLVREHGRPVQLHQDGASDAAVRRLADRVGRVDRLVRVARADVGGRPPLPADPFPAGDWLLARARSLAVATSRPQPLVQGRHLVALGVEEGRRIGEILATCYEAQLAGEFDSVEEGVALAKRLLGEP